MTEELPYSDCTLVNPLCPTDLCELWFGHPGTAEHKHLLGTMYGAAVPDDDEPERYVQEVSDVMFMAPRGTSDEELVDLGVAKADELWPDEDPPVTSMNDWNR